LLIATVAPLGAQAVRRPAITGVAFARFYTTDPPGAQKFYGVAKNLRDTQISCTRHQATATCAAFIEESRMKFTEANKLNGKSAVSATRPL
jgi:hypothetical protein